MKSELTGRGIDGMGLFREVLFGERRGKGGIG